MRFLSQELPQRPNQTVDGLFGSSFTFLLERLAPRLRRQIMPLLLPQVSHAVEHLVCSSLRTKSSTPDGTAKFAGSNGLAVKAPKVQHVFPVPLQ